MELTPQELTIISTLAGTFIGSLFMYLGMRASIKSEERKHYRDIVIKAALENWKASIDSAKLKASATGGPQLAYPLDSFIIHMIKLLELVLNKNLKKSNVIDRLKEVDEITDLVIKHVNTKVF
jgi:hypothetical protein